MTEPQKNDDGGKPEGQPDPASAPASNEDPEKGFWERLDKAVEAAADRVVEKRLKGLTSGGSQTGTSRGGNRSPNIPEVIANFMFGKQEQK